MTKNHGSNWRGWLSKSILTLVGLASFIACVGVNSAHAKWSTYALTASAVNADRVSSGSSHQCAINYKNQLYCWGRNDAYQVGNGVNTSPYPTAPVYIMDQVSSVLTVKQETFFIKIDGSLWAVGCNRWGEFGDAKWNQNACIFHPTPIQILPNTTPVRKISVDTHACAILVNGQVRCWGFDDAGQLGNGLIENWVHDSSTISLMTNAVDIAVGTNSSCAVKTTGEVYCWGSSVMPGQTWGATPTKINGITNAIQIVNGRNTYCVLKRPGGIVCWGENSYGELGGGTAAPNNSNALFGLTNVVGLPADITTITSQESTYCARMTNGSVYCWGRNDYYQVGNGTNVSPVLTPYQTIASGSTDLAIGSSSSAESCAIMVGGSLNCWGWTSYRAYPSDPNFGPMYPTPTQFVASGLISVPSTATGGTMSCAVKTNNNVNCWGQGYLGNGLNNPANSNVTVSGLTDAVQVGTSHNGFGCALRANGTVSCWGVNTFGYLGNGTTTDSLTPVPVSSLTGVSAIAVFNTHTCALIANNGSVYCWGYNMYGQLGYGTSGTGVYYTSPVRYGLVTGILAIGGNENATCVLGSNTNLSCSGRGGYIDNGTTVGSDTPQIEITSSGFIALTKESSGDFACGVNVLGDLWCWGANTYGQIGDGTQTYRYSHNKASLVQLVLSVGTGANSNCAFSALPGAPANQGVYCWGYGSNGAMGDTTTAAVNITAHLANDGRDSADLGEGDVRIARHTTALYSYAGESWGDNLYRQLDNATTALFSATPVTMIHYPQ